MILRVHTFGGFRADLDGVTVRALEGRPVRASLLVYLAVERGATRDALQALLWPESDREAAGRSLRQALYTLRRDFGGDFIESRGAQVVALPSLHCDVPEFEQSIRNNDAATALALYRGPFLEGAHLAEARAFGGWADARRAGSARAFRRVCREAVDATEAAGDLSAALEVCRAWVTVDPLEDEAQHRLIQLLADSGRRAEALHQFAEYERLLRVENLQPLEETRALVASVRNAPSLRKAQSEDTMIGSAPGRLPGTVPNGVASGNSPAAAAEPQASQEAGRLPRTRVGGVARMVIAAAAVMVVAILAWILWPETQVDADLVRIDRFENATGDPVLDGLARLIEEQLAAASTRAGLPAVAGGTARAGTVISGTLHRTGGQLAVHARLSRAGRGVHHVDPVTRPASDEAALVGAVVQYVIGAVVAFRDPQFTAWRDGLSRPPRHDALVEFVSGLHNIAAAEEAAAYSAMLAALRLDTGFVQAKAMLIIAGTPERNPTQPSLRDSLQRAVRHHRDAATPFDRLTLDRALAIWDGLPTYPIAQQLAELAPESAEALFWLASDAFDARRFTEAVEALHRLRRVDMGWLAEGRAVDDLELRAHHFAGQFAQELQEVTLLQHRWPDAMRICTYALRPIAALGRPSAVDSALAACFALPTMAQHGPILMDVAAELLEHGHRQYGMTMLERTREWYEAQRPGTNRDRMLARVHFMREDWPAVMEVERRIITRGSPVLRDYARLGAAAAHMGDQATVTEMEQALTDAGEPPLEMAMVAAASGRHERAMSHLRDWRGTPLPVVLHGMTILQPLRGYPAFDAVFRQRR